MDEGFEVPDGLESEPISLTLQNDGKQVHRAFFARLNQGVTEEDVRSALSKGPDALFPLLTLAGNMPEAKAGATSEIGMLFQYLRPGGLTWKNRQPTPRSKPETSTSRSQIQVRVRQSSRSRTSASKATK
jgi:hypothetical protein